MRLAWLVPLLVGAAACGTARPVAPLGVGETALAVSLGGPLLRTFGVVIPTPILDVSVARGLSDRWAATAALDVTAAAYGNLHLQPGAVYFPVVGQDGPTVGLAGSVHVITTRADVLVAPHLGATAAWRLADGLRGYLGADAAVAMATGGGKTRIIAGPLLGAELARGRARFGVELKWLAPNYDTTPTAPGWVSPGGRGYLSVLLAAGYHWGTR